MSLNPRKTPCIAKDKSTAGAPSDLSVKYLRAGASIGDPCFTESNFVAWLFCTYLFMIFEEA